MAPKVVFINRFFHPDVSATSQILSNLATELARAGLDVHVVCSRQLYEDPRANLPPHAVVDCVHVHRVWTARFGRDRLLGRALDYASFYLTAAAMAWRLLRRRDILVAKTDPPLISIVGAAVASWRGAILVNWLQDIFPEVASRLRVAPMPGWLESAVRRARDRSLAAAAMNVVLGARMRAYVSSCGVASSRLRVVENWMDGEAVRPKPPSESDLRVRLGLQECFVIAYSGNLGRAHEFDTILAAAEQLRADRGVVFLMIGGGVKMQTLQHVVRERGLTGFRFLPYQPRGELGDCLAAADIHLACLLPELEGLIVPSKFYGILAAGRPVIFIGDPEGEIAIAIRAAECGTTVKCGEGSALAQAIMALRSDRGRLEEMGSRAREAFDARYTLERALKEWIDVLGQLGARADQPGT